MTDNSGFKEKSIRFCDETVLLGECVGKGAEGAVHRIVGDESTAVKVFWGNMRDKKAAKVRAMVNNPPHDSSYEKVGGPTILWPKAVGEDPETDEFLGYRMPYKDLSRAKNALRYATEELQWDQSTSDHRQTIALNIAIIVETVHRQGHAVLDFNHQDILIEDGFVTLIDCDRFVIQGEDHIYSGDTCMLRYTPPEQPRNTLKDVQEGDRFGLGVQIFQLLMEGFHPFIAQGPKAANGAFEDLIRVNQFPYDVENTGYQPPDNAPDYDQLPADIKELFEHCFHDTESEKKRPVPSEWIDALTTTLV